MSRPLTASARRRRVIGFAGLAFATLVALIAFIVVGDRRERAVTHPDRIARDPSTIVITRPGFSPIRLEKVDGSLASGESPASAAAWRIVSPCPLVASAQRVAPLVDALNAVSSSYPAGEVDARGAGLAAPLATLRLDDETIALGGTDLGGNRRYAATGPTAARRVDLVPEWVFSLVTGGLSAFAEPSPFGSDVVGIRRAGRELGDETDLDAWSALAANQIVEWPIEDADEPIATERLDFELADGRTLAAQLEFDDAFVALRLENGGCAHLLAPGAIPALPVP